MPIHDYECPECQKVGEHFVPLERLDKEVICCGDCRRQAVRLFTAPRGGDVSDYARVSCPMSGWYDESLNKTFHSQSEKKKYLKAKGLVSIPEGAHGIKKEKRRQYFAAR